ncbi:MAG: DUF4280 domain-containing protein [Clostridiales Family XIII bacterium]|nr:DUF4280 domain-containing protein [Clostridiales Family XIII bacterium]
MAVCACTGASMFCSFGLAPSTLNVTSNLKVLTSKPAATIMDFRPMVNIPPFGMCTSLANPMVASATAAALGVLTPMPCIPNTMAPWIPGSPMVIIGNYPALSSTSQLICAYGGMIKIISPGQMKVLVP